MSKLYTIYDSKASVFTAPMLQRNSAEFIRGFSTVVNDGKSSYSLYPEDFTAFEIGDFSSDSGSITCHKDLVSVCRAIDLVKQTPSQ